MRPGGLSGRVCGSEAGENTPSIIRILFSLLGSMVCCDGEVLGVLPCLYFTF